MKIATLTLILSKKHVLIMKEQEWIMMAHLMQPTSNQKMGVKPCTCQGRLKTHLTKYLISQSHYLMMVLRRHHLLIMPYGSKEGGASGEDTPTPLPADADSAFEEPPPPPRVGL